MLVPIVSGFAGAFFAYLFMRLADTGKGIVNRQNRHFRALGKLEFLMNDLQRELNSNVYELNNFLKTYESQRSNSGKTILTPNRPQALHIPDDFADGLGNVELLNELFTYRMQALGINGDIKAIWNIHEKYQNLVFEHPDRFPDYLDNFRFSAESVGLLVIAHEKLLEKTNRILAIIRVLYKRDRTILHRLTSSSVKEKYPNDMESKIVEEQEALEEEIQSSHDESKQRISEILREQANRAD